MKILTKSNPGALMLLLISILFSSCGKVETGMSTEIDGVDSAVSSEALDTKNAGYALLKSTCYACHNPTAESHDKMIAPPLAGIKMRYLRDHPNRDEFIRTMSGFISNPKTELAKMKGPVRRFGLMPNPNLEQEDIQRIVEFIYDNKLDEPDWFSDHEKAMHTN